MLPVYLCRLISCRSLPCSQWPTLNCFQSFTHSIFSLTFKTWSCVFCGYKHLPHLKECHHLHPDKLSPFLGFCSLHTVFHPSQYSLYDVGHYCTYLNRVISFSLCCAIRCSSAEEKLRKLFFNWIVLWDICPSLLCNSQQESSLCPLVTIKGDASSYLLLIPLYYLVPWWRFKEFFLVVFRQFGKDRVGLGWRVRGPFFVILVSIFHSLVYRRKFSFARTLRNAPSGWSLLPQFFPSLFKLQSTLPLMSFVSSVYKLSTFPQAVSPLFIKVIIS